MVALAAAAGRRPGPGGDHAPAVTQRAEQARLAFWIALAGGGLGWLLVAAKYALGLADAPFPHAIYTFEPNTWFGLLGYPYLPLAQGFMCIALVGAFRVHTAPSPAAWAACAIGALGVALLHAYDLVVVYAVVGTFWIVELVRGARHSVAILVGDRPDPRLLGAAGRLLPVPDVLRSALAIDSRPVRQRRRVDAAAAAAGGAARRAAGPGGGAAARDSTGTTAARGSPPAWALIGVVIIYVPTVFQIKLLAALQVPLAILAADLWVTRLAPWLRSWSARWGGRAAAAWVPALVLALLVLPTNMYLLVWRLIELRRPASELYVTTDESAALDALAVTTGPGDVALAVESVGRWVPNQGRTRAYLAHWAMTNKYLDRRQLVDRFFSAEADDAWRAQLLAADGVTYVVWTDRDRAAGRTFSPADSPLFEPVFLAPTAGVFKVRTAPLPR